MNVLECDEVRTVFFAQVEDLSDVCVVQLNGNFCLIDEHLDEVFVLSDIRKNPFDGNESLEALYAELLGTKHLGHTADVDALKKVVLAELDGLIQGRTYDSKLWERQDVTAAGESKD